MIEVEIRGKLTEEEYLKTKAFLEQNGILKEKHNREMYMLLDAPGFSVDPTTREVDIRLRNTDGFCEIMVKTKLNDGNSARKEMSLPLVQHDLETAKLVVKALGCKRALKMVREKEVYEYGGVEWSLVNCPPKNIRYFEAEKESPTEESIPAAKESIVEETKKLGLEPLNDADMKEFIYWLDEQVNVEVEL